MRTLDKTTELIREWALQRGLLSADPAKQMVKLVEELGELASGIARNDKQKKIDSIGDVYVVLTILAMQLGFDIEACVDFAYHEIKNRKGTMVNGIFVKEGDLK